jgi:hypothetical protein
LPAYPTEPREGRSTPCAIENSNPDQKFMAVVPAISSAAGVEFASDSLLERTGFEPSVPRDTTKVSRGAHFALLIPRNGKAGANENRHHNVSRPR